MTPQIPNQTPASILAKESAQDLTHITDSHCHLDHTNFDAEQDDIVARAHAAGVTRMVTICTKLRLEPQIRKISESYDSVFYAAGTHPMSVADEPMASVEELVKLAKHPKFVGIGESGLDYHYTVESMAAQKESLQIHIEAARQTGLPLIIHSRDADDDMADILSKEHAAGTFECVLHCFSSSRALAEVALSMNFYLSMSGITAFPKSDALRDIFHDAPLTSILVETDAQYLAPPPMRGKRNEPAFTAHTARAAAQLFELDYADFAAQTQANFERLFSKAANWKAT